VAGEFVQVESVGDEWPWLSRKDVWTCGREGHKVGVGPVSRIWADLAGAVIVIPAKQVDDVEQGRTTVCNVGSGLRKTARRSTS
jgi:hypothetical protein